MASPARSDDAAVLSGVELRGSGDRISWTVAKVRTRMRLQATISRVLRFLPAVLAVLCAVVLMQRAGWLPPHTWLWLLIGSGSALVFASYWMSRRILSLEAALVIDRSFQFEGQFVAAYEFSRVDKAEGRGFEELVIARVARLFPFAPARAFAFTLPGNTSWVLGSAAVLFAISFWPASSTSEPQIAPAASPQAPIAALAGDDAELVRERAEKLAEQASSDEGKRLAAQFNQLVIQLTDGSLNRSEGFRAAAALRSQLEEKSSEAEAVARGMAKRGELLQQKAVTQGVGRAMTEHRLLDAQEALKKLAERLRAPAQGLTERELAELRKSLDEVRKAQEADAESERAAAEQADRRSSLEKQREELAKKSRDGTAAQEELKKLEETERELKKLDRKRKQQETAAEQLSELDRKLAEAARALVEERKKDGGDFLQEAADQVGQAAAKQLSDEEKKELIKQLEALKERLREQRKEGDQAERMRNFQRRARGEPQPQGEQGQGKSGQGQGRQTQVTLTPSGAPVPSPTAKPGQGSGDSAEQSDSSSPGKEPGHGHDDQLAGDPNRLNTKGYDDKAAAGQDNGQGPSESETIASAAERGFVSGSYQKLYQEYRTVAEEVMEKDRIPPGRRTHIQRYFELIRPRETK